jgi:hypothetical protein
MEQYFDAVAKWPGYEDFEKEAWRFKVCPFFYLYLRMLRNTDKIFSTIA